MKQVKTRSSDVLNDPKREMPRFSELLHAASHSPDDPDSWPTSTSDTDEEDQTAYCHSDTTRSRGGTRCQGQDCVKHVISDGLCQQTGRTCSQEGCNKHVASGGLCRTHGGGRRCQVPGCTSGAQSRGLCYVHGGGGRCQHEGCGSSAKKGGFCIAHGGGHRCQVAGCTSSAVSGSRCRAHGGGRRCAVDGCTSSAKTGGRCIAHGGGKRCSVAGCTSSAQRLGLCKAHGGGRRCVVENCANSAVSRGRCIAHGGGKRCVFEGCTTTARKGGYCFAHGGRSAGSRPKTVSTPATVPVNARPWQPTEGQVPIPTLTLPPRRLLPPIGTMMMANRPGILRRYTRIPPIRRPIVSFGRGSGRVRNVMEENWPKTGKRDRSDAGAPGQTPHMTPPTRSGYSWQRLQETIRRESRVHGIMSEEDEAYDDKSVCKVESSEVKNDVLPTQDVYYWTRSRGPTPS
ncbi:putative WRKY transcription factor 19 [Phytophthora citrophthora]|uniref:WRKY transcription factor 19 n=1 Tax=Phytophthora citrophthora TaxID=4793 RepID=A0AAD9GXR0_9STRA|nr:putative WRKY transcription factor 19 [Phytophthora citrophthora]